MSAIIVPELGEGITKATVRHCFRMPQSVPKSVTYMVTGLGTEVSSTVLTAQYCSNWAVRVTNT